MLGDSGVGKTSIVKVEFCQINDHDDDHHEYHHHHVSDHHHHDVGGCGSCKRLTRLLLQLTTSLERGPASSIEDI